MNFGMPVGECNSAGGIVVVGWLINPGIHTGIEQARVAHAVGLLVQIYPCFRTRWRDKPRSRDNVLVNTLPRTRLRITGTDADVAGNAAHPFSPAALFLDLGQIHIGRALEDVLV